MCRRVERDAMFVKVYAGMLTWGLTVYLSIRFGCDCGPVSVKS